MIKYKLVIWQGAGLVPYTERGDLFLEEAISMLEGAALMRNLLQGEDPTVPTHVAILPEGFDVDRSR